MKIIVEAHKITLEKEEIINAGEYNIQECNFEFSEEYENLVKVAIFSTQTNSYKVNINETNKCIIPYDVLENKNVIEIGVYGYEIDGTELIKRYSPSPEVFQVEDGSYKLGEEVDPPSPSIIEQLQQEVETLSNNVLSLQNSKVDKIDGKGLSTNDYTDEDKTKLGTLENYDDTEIRQNIQTNAANISNLQTNKADKNEIPDVSEFITKDVDNLTYYTKTSNLSTVATSGNYEDLSNKPTIPSKTSDLTNNSGFITNAVNNLTNYTLKTSTGSLIDLEVNSSTYVITLYLKDIDGNVISTDTIDLPLESVVVSGSFDSTNKKIVLTLQNGNTVDIPVGDLVAGLQTEITSTNKLNADYVDDTNSGNKFTNTTEKTAWNAKYDKPSGGIPSTDLASAVQTSLGKADTAIQSSDLTNYVQNTDYATDNVGGVIKTVSANWYAVNSSGEMSSIARTYEQYLAGRNAAFICKGTLENVIIGKQLVNQTYVDNIVGNIATALDNINNEVI